MLRLPALPCPEAKHPPRAAAARSSARSPISPTALAPSRTTEKSGERGSSSRSFLERCGKNVAGAAHRLDQVFRPSRIAQLLAHFAHVHVDAAVKRRKLTPQN